MTLNISGISYLGIKLFWFENGASHLTEKIDESTYRTHLRRVLSLPAGASRRQLKRARDREAQKCRDDFLSDNPEARSLAKQRLDDVHLAFDCLADPKAFRAQLEKVNDEILQGKLTREQALLLRKEMAPQPVPVRGPSAPGALPDAEADSTGDGGKGSSLQDERLLVKELRDKRVGKEPKIGRKKAQQIERITRETMTGITAAAKRSASENALALSESGRTESDEFYEALYSSVRRDAEQVMNDAIAEMNQLELPVEDSLLDSFAMAVEDATEDATDYEYNKLEGIVAREPESGRKKFWTVILTSLTIVSVTFLFCFVSFVKTAEKPSSVDAQFGLADHEKAGMLAVKGLSPQQPVSDKTYQAYGRGLSPVAGPAGFAWRTTYYSIDGVGEYNLGLDAVDRSDYDAAEKHFMNSIMTNHNVYQTVYNLGVTHLSQGKLSAALADFTNTLGIKCDLAQALYNKGFVYYRSSVETIKAMHDQSKSQEERDLMAKRSADTLHAAINTWTAAAVQAPRIGQPLFNRAVARYRLGDLKGARADFDEALRRDSSLTAARQNIDFIDRVLADPETEPEIDDSKVPDGPTGPPGPPGPGAL